MTPFSSITIIGCGLIGSSLSRAVRAAFPDIHIICADSSADVVKRAQPLGFANEVTTDIAAAVRNADLVVLAMPVGAYGDVARLIAGYLKAGAVISDVGSIKQNAVAAVAPYVPAHVHFVPAHPIAGTEHSGPEAGFAELFCGRWCILTPPAGTDQTAIDRVAALWQGVGAKVEIMDAKRHDLVLAITSHLPHLIAYSIVDTAATLEEHTKEDVIKYSAGGFRDFTRIAASDPVMWRDVFLNNKDAVLEILQRFNEDLTALQKAIRNGDGETLFDVFSRTRAIRRAVIDARQN